VLTARLREGQDGNWTLSIMSKIGDSKHQMSGGTLKIPREKIEWMSSVSATDGQVLGSCGTDVREVDGPIILLQRRACEKQPDGSYQPSNGPMPGFMIWLSNMVAQAWPRTFFGVSAPGWLSCWPCRTLLASCRRLNGAIPMLQSNCCHSSMKSCEKLAAAKRAQENPGHLICLPLSI
jgi:hypothetical protein